MVANQNKSRLSSKSIYSNDLSVVFNWWIYREIDIMSIYELGLILTLFIISFNAIKSKRERWRKGISIPKDPGNSEGEDQSGGSLKTPIPGWMSSGHLPLIFFFRNLYPGGEWPFSTSLAVEKRVFPEYPIRKKGFAKPF